MLKTALDWRFVALTHHLEYMNAVSGRIGTAEPFLISGVPDGLRDSIKAAHFVAVNVLYHQILRTHTV